MSISQLEVVCLDERRERKSSLIACQLEGELKQVRTELGSALREDGQGNEQARLQPYGGCWREAKKQQKLGILQQSADSECQNEVARLTTRLNHLERELQEKEEKVKELGEALLVLDQDHDGLRTECDQKDEKIAQLTKVVEERVSGVLEFRDV